MEKMIDRMFQYDRLPLKSSLDEWIENALPPGGFLEAVICNDLAGAVHRADGTNLDWIPTYVAYLYNEAPRACWGSLQAWREWTEAGGLAGMRRKAKASLPPEGNILPTSFKTKPVDPPG